jgi:hypothetical protein
VAGALRDRGDATHERAADAEDVQMHVSGAWCVDAARYDRNAK